MLANFEIIKGGLASTNVPGYAVGVNNMRRAWVCVGKYAMQEGLDFSFKDESDYISKGSK